MKATFSLLALLASAALLPAAPPPKSVVPAKAPPQSVIGKPANCACVACGCADCDCSGGQCRCPSCMAVTRADGKIEHCINGTCYLLTPSQAKDTGLLAALRGQARTTAPVYAQPVYAQPLYQFGGSCPNGQCSPGR